MSRPLRLEFAGALYHVTSRGNERKPIFRNESDFSTFIEENHWGQVLHCAKVIAKVIGVKSHWGQVLHCAALIKWFG